MCFRGYEKWITTISTALLISSINFCLSETVTFPGYQRIEGREYLFCPESSPACARAKDCCVCNALPCWKINASACSVHVTELYIEYTDPFGVAVLVDRPTDRRNNTLFTFKHTDGRLRKLPTNICDYADTLLEIDLTNNFIDDISEIKCLKSLESLRLDHNRITEIPDGTFSKMENLIHLSLSHNELVDLQAFAIKLDNGNNIINVDFSHNFFRRVDVTNILRPGPFCTLSFEASHIEDQTNTEGYAIQKDTFHGPGKLDFGNSSGQTWLNFTSVGLEHYSEFGLHMNFVIDWDSTSIHCDCNVVPFLEGLGKSASTYWPNIAQEFGVDFVCAAPERMKGVSLTKIYNEGDYTDLVCDLEICPSGCVCTDRQSQNIVSVKCVNMKAFPDEMPIGFWGNNKLEVEISGKDLTEIPNRDYLSRVTILNVTDTSISHLSYDAINLMRNAKLYLPSVEILYLPSTFFNLNPDNINFGQSPVFCDCSNLWIGEWVAGKSPSTDLNCSTSDMGIVRAILVTADFLDCPLEDPFPIELIWVLGGAVLGITALMIISALVYYFRYEVIFLKRRFSFKPNTEPLDNDEFDVFLSYSEENDEVRVWARNRLLPYLEGRKFKCYVTSRNMSPGDTLDHATIEAVDRSRNFLIVLSRCYMTDLKSTLEFDTIWKNFYMDKNKQLIVINYEPLSSLEVEDRRLKANLRIGYDLNYKKRETKLLHRLGERLGMTRRRTIPAQNSELSFYNIEEQDLEVPLQELPRVRNTRYNKEWSIGKHNKDGATFHGEHPWYIDECINQQDGEFQEQMIPRYRKQGPEQNQL